MWAAETIFCMMVSRVSIFQKGMTAPPPLSRIPVSHGWMSARAICTSIQPPVFERRRAPFSGTDEFLKNPSPKWEREEICRKSQSKLRSGKLIWFYCNFDRELLNVSLVGAFLSLLWMKPRSFCESTFLVLEKLYLLPLVWVQWINWISKFNPDLDL